MMSSSKCTTSKEKLAILFVQTHWPDPKSTNAADWWRMVNPATELAKHIDWEVEIRRGIVSKQAAKDAFSKAAILEWQQIGINFDVVYYSYQHNPLFYSHLAVAARKFNRTFIIDYDDNLLEQDLMNPTSLVSATNDPGEEERVKIILEDIPGISVTGEYLKNTYKSYLDSVNIQKPIYVIPNYINLDVYTRPEIKKGSGEVVIGFFGSTSHQADLYDGPFHQAINVIIKKYPQVRFEIMGRFIPGYIDGVAKSTKIEGNQNFYEWVELWKKHICNWDIGVAPLRNTPFNLSRSNIKWQEFAAAKVPMVTSDIGHYTSELVLKAGTKEEWVAHLSKLVEDATYRNNLGEENYQGVKKNWTIQSHWQEYQKMFEEMVKYGNQTSS